MPLSRTWFRHGVSTAFALVLSLVAASARAHDMFLVIEDHAVAAHSRVTVSLYNGTFDKSENVITRDRMLDVTVVDARGEKTHPESDRWREAGDVTLLDLDTAAPGTYVVGVSTAARTIALTAEEFAEYLRHDGVLDVLAARERDGRAGEAARERYSKHVKTLLTVGGASSGSWATRLGYPIEIVPLADPAAVAPGASLELLVLHDGVPAADQLVYASHAGHHAHGDDGSHREAVSARTDASGKVTIPISRPGRWYVRLIRMLEVDEPEIDYESNWATLTFQVGASGSASKH